MFLDVDLDVEFVHLGKDARRDEQFYHNLHRLSPLQRMFNGHLACFLNPSEFNGPAHSSYHLKIGVDCPMMPRK